MGTYNKQTTRIKGNRNIVGNNNSVNSRHEEHHYHYHQGASSKPNKSDDAAGAGIGVLFALATTCWFFVKNSDAVYFYLQLAACISCAPIIATWLLVIFGNDVDNKQTVAACYGVVIAFITFMLALYGQSQLDPALLLLSQNAKNGWEFWQRLSPYGQEVVIGSLISAICIGGAAFFNFLMGLFVTWDVIASDYYDSHVMSRILNPFRPKIGGVLIAFLTLIAAAFQFGFVFNFIK
ncbi:hypothetical protein GN109_23350 [Collimonas pratensis]|uniref:hypothetical protein n=1 Tax=Collimonas pratensis TaxID=279113 RepID=UPI00143DF71C|nr:hypothetical protein [Collimonas pratensis]NKI72366.1 hypothetical protein [Collimonas pratensis]